MTQDSDNQRPFHYKGCGLDNIYLLNGFTFHTEEDEEQSISFEDLEGLHTAIGMHIIKYVRKLDGKEIKFLRKEMEATQSMLASLLGVTEDTVRRWEKGDSINEPADRLIRLLYIEHVNCNPKIHDLLEKLSQLETDHDGGNFVKTSDDGWKAAA